MKLTLTQDELNKLLTITSVQPSTQPGALQTIAAKLVEIDATVSLKDGTKLMCAVVVQ